MHDVKQGNMLNVQQGNGNQFVNIVPLKGLSNSQSISALNMWKMYVRVLM